ncbi:hypothetical protein PZB74_00710 [Porifericola rhodea]|uniref:hypothetical protein n=1 Tax=Porifericola rhodea TaxID=930972 RepID=UPI00266539F7|nr:hypothetical protein [Porifericola rhodea]WKN31879.1 hypothetical protein PZB74_00710 [Porifericola rhodea]
MNKTLLFAGAMAGTMALASCDSSGGAGFGAWDADRNEIIDNNEFDQAFTTSSHFGDWNEDNNSFISKEEFYEGYAKMMDRDNNGAISNTEWDQAVNSYFTGYEYQPDNEYSDWDGDSDGNLSTQEVRSSLSKTDYFDEWDKDGNGELSEKEFAKGVFTTWDTDGDGFIQAEEYTNWYDTGQ